MVGRMFYVLVGEYSSWWVWVSTIVCTYYLKWSKWWLGPRWPELSQLWSPLSRHQGWSPEPRSPSASRSWARWDTAGWPHWRWPGRRWSAAWWAGSRWSWPGCPGPRRWAGCRWCSPASRPIQESRNINISALIPKTNTAVGRRS